MLWISSRQELLKEDGENGGQILYCRSWKGLLTGKKKKKHNIKAENYVLFGIFSEDLSLEDSLSDHSEGLLQKGKGEARIYRSFCKTTTTKKTGSRNIKKLLLIKENQTSQVNEFSAFLCMQRCKSLAQWNHSFDMHLNYLGPVSFFSPSWILSGYSREWLQWLLA